MSLNSEIFKNIDNIPRQYWEDLNCYSNIYYSPEFLRAFECANKGIEFNYIIILRAHKAVAFANTQIVTISIETITKNIKISKYLRKLINKLFCKNQPRILFCGNVFLSGEYGIFLKDDEQKITTFNDISLTE